MIAQSNLTKLIGRLASFPFHHFLFIFFDRMYVESVKMIGKKVAPQQIFQLRIPKQTNKQKIRSQLVSSERFQ